MSRAHAPVAAARAACDAARAAVADAVAARRGPAAVRDAMRDHARAADAFELAAIDAAHCARTEHAFAAAQCEYAASQVAQVCVARDACAVNPSDDARQRLVWAQEAAERAERAAAQSARVLRRC